MTQITERGASFSPCRKYRYSLWRSWRGFFSRDNRYAMIIGLNPSTADENDDDPTIRRCISFARSWGYEALCMANLFAYRATKPEDMMVATDPVGPENDRILLELAKNSGIVVAAWGTHGAWMGRDNWAKKEIPALHYLRLTKGGQPSHPLYLPQTLKPLMWLK